MENDMTKIQDIKFGKNEVIVSVGFFLSSDFAILKETYPKYVENYEPLSRAFVAHATATVDMPNVINIRKAVSGTSGETYLSMRSTKSSICYNSEVMKSELVEVVSMSSILERLNALGHIDKLLINCEGSEISIIDKTPIELFLRCNKIFIQFHSFIPELNITRNDVTRCLTKLGSIFEYKLISSRKYSKYLLEKRI